MTNRISYVEINGVEYPLNFSVQAADLIGEKYGDISQIGKVFESSKIHKMLNEFLWLVYVLIEQGIAYLRITEEREMKSLPYADLVVLVGMQEAMAMQDTVMAAISMGMQAEVEVEQDVKNADTTQVD